MLTTLIAVATLAAFAVLARHDFYHLRIRNAAVLALIGLYLAFAWSLGWATLRGDLVAGGVLFALGTLFWLLGMTGAGDAKAALPLGLFCGLPGLSIYAIALLIGSALLLVMLKLSAKRAAPASKAGRRLHEIAKTGRVPYGVPMFAAAGVTLALRTAVIALN